MFWPAPSSRRPGSNIRPNAVSPAPGGVTTSISSSFHARASRTSCSPPASRSCPQPRQLTIDRILGNPIALLGYASETTIAEKGVTILADRRGLSRTTVGSSSGPSHRTLLDMAKSDKRNGQRGAARSTSNPFARRISTTRPNWSRPTSIRSSSLARVNGQTGRAQASTTGQSVPQRAGGARTTITDWTLTARDVRCQSQIIPGITGHFELFGPSTKPADSGQI